MTPSESPIVHRFSLVTEAFNLDEGQSLKALHATLSFMTEHYSSESIELMIAVTSPDNAALRTLMSRFASVVVVDCNGLGYDEAKMKAALAARGDVIAFLDGDCIPVDAGWLPRLSAPFADPDVACTAGLTLYEGGLPARICSILDFGFLYDVGDGEAVGCYASNNFAVRRTHLLANPIPASNLRCNCYYHAQLSLERGAPFILVASAVVRHEFPSFFKERWRRGTDFVLETHANTKLRRARSDRSALRSAYRLYCENLNLDRKRLALAPAVLRFSRWERSVASLCFPLLRLVDFAGVVVALRADERRSRMLVAAPPGGSSK